MQAEEQLDAMRDVLRAISRSPFDLDGVLGIVVERLAKLCRAEYSMVYLPTEDGMYVGAAAWGMVPEHRDYEREHPTPVTPGTLVGRVVLAGEAVQIEDATNDPTYSWKSGQQLGGFRTMLGVPIRTEQRLIGVVGLARTERSRYTDDEIELVRSFADQAAPPPVAEHTLVGVRMASAMRARFAELSEKWRRQAHELGFGTGFAVGFATLGRIGFKGHYGYAIIGSVANLAARLCAVAKPDQIILSGRAYSRVEDHFDGQSMGALELKGFRRPVEAFELLAPRKK